MKIDLVRLYDSAKDYYNHELNSFCHKEGIINEFSSVKTPS
jgi:hypothetical protein